MKVKNLAKDEHGKMRVGATATTRINRRDFGHSFGKKLDTGEALVGDEATVTIDVQLVHDS